MPVIQIRSLPMDDDVDLTVAVAELTRDFAERTGISIEHVSATWTLLEPGHYAFAGESAAAQPQDTHPVLVDLIAPDFHRPERVASMLRAVAASVSERARVPETNVFVVYHGARSGMVYDSGEIVRW